MRIPSKAEWKNSTFVIGLAWLLLGAHTFEYPDWDVGLSLLMAGSTYLTADRAAGALVTRRYTRWPLAILATWWSVDGSYWLYWSIVGPEVMIREGQWAMSLCLYLLCGFIWRIEPRDVLHQLRTGSGPSPRPSRRRAAVRHPTNTLKTKPVDDGINPRAIRST